MSMTQNLTGFPLRMADVEEQIIEEEVPEPTPVPFHSLLIAYAALSGK